MKTYKAEIIIRTKEFCHISPTVEGTPEEIVEAYKEFDSLIEQSIKSQAGLPRKEFIQALDRYLTDGTGETAQFLAMGTDKVYSQQDLFQELKLAFKRIKSRNGDKE